MLSFICHKIRLRACTEYGEGAVSILQIKKRHVYFENHHLKSRLLPGLTTRGKYITQFHLQSRPTNAKSY